MIEKYSYILLLLFLVSTTFSQGHPSLPDNFIEWQNSADTSNSVVRESTTQNRNGLVPKPYDDRELLKSNPVKKKRGRGVLPLSVDIRDSGFVSPVKNQGQTNNCWAFTSIATVEGELLKEKGILRDYSEKNMRNSTYFDLDPIENGGNDDMSGAYLIGQRGPVLESLDPFDEYDKTSQSFPNDLIVTEKRIFVGDTAIKQAIIDYGPLYTIMFASENDSYFKVINGATTYYYPDSLDYNHAVTVIGWDDNKITDAPTKGAWLIKNSWGKSWGDNGYFWLSYADRSSLTEAISFNKLKDPSEYNNFYYYDTLGRTSTSGWQDGDDWGAATFVARDNEQIASVGTYIIGNNGVATIYIYGNRSIRYGNCYFDSLLDSVTATFGESGYYTVELPAKPLVSIGDSFNVVIRYQIPNVLYPIPVEVAINNYSSRATADSGQTFVSNYGNSFQDFYKIYEGAASVAINVYTTSVENLAFHNDTVTSLIKEDSTEIDTILIGYFNKDTVVTTTIFNVVVDSVFCIKDSVENGNIVYRDTSCIKDFIYNTDTVVYKDTLLYQEPNAIIAQGDVKLVNVEDLIVFPVIASSKDNQVDIIIPSKLSGSWEIEIFDVIGNLIDKADFYAYGGTTYSWDLHSFKGNRVSTGSYLLVAQYLDEQGKERVFKRIIGVKR